MSLSNDFFWIFTFGMAINVVNVWFGEFVFIEIKFLVWYWRNEANF